MSEAGEQVTACFVRMGGKAVKPEAIDQQMRHVAPHALARHVTVELLVDDLHLIPGEGAAVFVIRAQRTIID